MVLQWTAEFLQTREFLPRWHRCLRLYQGVSILLIVGFFCLPYRPIAIVTAYFLLATSGLTTVLGVLTYRRGYHPARFYLLSCFSLFFSIFLSQLAFLGIIPGSLWIRESPRLGLIALVIFLSLALGDRINLLKAEKLQEQQKALEEKDELNTDLQLIQKELIKRERKLEYDAYHDILTGLPNRAWLMQRLHHLTQQELSYGILFADLDQFKFINDTLGHPVGDKLLKYASLRLQSILNSNTNVARLGGDEFVFLLENISGIEEAINLADLVQMQLQLPFKLGNYELYISASIGINLGTGEYRKPDEVLRDADLAMYQAKHKGRGRYEIFDLRIRRLAMDRLHLEHEMRQGIDRQEFCLYYQPIVSLETQKICGVEALVRWEHPAGKIILPEQFIRIAEETGLINPLGWWILEEACRQMQQWQQDFGYGFNLFMNVNVSPIQLKQLDLVHRIKQLLQETGVSGHCLKLEITESCLLETTDAQLMALNQLRDLGIKLCIDDFGTGYSSLNRLHTLPINTLKIDRSFVDRLIPNLPEGNSGDNTEIIEMIIALAHSLEMSTVAEGIELPSQAEKLNTLGCQFGQGYLFSRPLTASSLTQLLLRSETQVGTDFSRAIHHPS
jgi:diguanylate cyclase (GGDEF)-like protein